MAYYEGEWRVFETNGGTFQIQWMGDDGIAGALCYGEFNTRLEAEINCDELNRQQAEQRRRNRAEYDKQSERRTQQAALKEK
jgi:hypothetical protein